MPSMFSLARKCSQGRLIIKQSLNLSFFRGRSFDQRSGRYHRQSMVKRPWPQCPSMLRIDWGLGLTTFRRGPGPHRLISWKEWTSTDALRQRVLESWLSRQRETPKQQASGVEPLVAPEKKKKKKKKITNENSAGLTLTFKFLQMGCVF